MSCIITEFLHPQLKLFGLCDPPHTTQNVCNMLAEFEDHKFPEKGMIGWSCVSRLQQVQDEHGLQLDN